MPAVTWGRCFYAQGPPPGGETRGKQESVESRPDLHRTHPSTSGETEACIVIFIPPRPFTTRVRAPRLRLWETRPLKRRLGARKHPRERRPAPRRVNLKRGMVQKAMLEVMVVSECTQVHARVLAATLKRGSALSAELQRTRGGAPANSEGLVGERASRAFQRALKHSLLLSI